LGQSISNLIGVNLEISAYLGYFITLTHKSLLGLTADPKQAT
jgi:hypothetical protein